MKLEKKREILRDMFSFSKLMAFAKCPRYAFNRYVARIKTPPAEYFKDGRAVHDGQEHDNKERVKGRKPSQEEILDVAVTRYEEEEGENVDRFRAYHEEQLKKYFESGQRDQINPVPGSIEMPFEIDVLVTGDPQCEPAEPATIQGFTDTKSYEEDGRESVVDYKTVARPVSDKEAQASIQNCLYILGGETDCARNVSFVKPGRQKAGAKTTKLVTYDQEFVNKLLTVVGDNIASFRKNLKSGDWPKCAPHCFWCEGGDNCEFGEYCYPKRNPDLRKYISITEVRPVGTVEMPEWKKRKK